MKTIGHKRELTPEESVRAQARLIASVERLRPYPRVTGRILRFRDWQSLDEFNRTRAANQT